MEIFLKSRFMGRDFHEKNFRVEPLDSAQKWPINGVTKVLVHKRSIFSTIFMNQIFN